MGSGTFLHTPTYATNSLRGGPSLSIPCDCVYIYVANIKKSYVLCILLFSILPLIAKKLVRGGNFGYLNLGRGRTRIRGEVLMGEKDSKRPFAAYCSFWVGGVRGRGVEVRASTGDGLPIAHIFVLRTTNHRGRRD